MDFEPVITFVNNTYSVNDLLYAAYRKAGALKIAGQGISPSESAEGLQILNTLIDGLKIENLTTDYIRRTVQALINGQKSYGVGPGQDWDLERPEHIVGASYLVPSVPENQKAEIAMEIILTFEEWQSFVVKEVQSSFPLALYYQAAVPYGVARVWPVPNQDTTMVIYTPQLLSEFSTVDDILLMRDGWREMLEYNLAVAVHEVYPNKPMAPSVEARADFYKKRVKANQMTPMFMASDGGARQNGLGRNWFGGYARAYVPYTGRG